MTLWMGSVLGCVGSEVGGGRAEAGCMASCW
jgi:hypothetical protein